MCIKTIRWSTTFPSVTEGAFKHDGRRTWAFGSHSVVIRFSRAAPRSRILSSSGLSIKESKLANVISPELCEGSAHRPHPGGCLVSAAGAISG